MRAAVDSWSMSGGHLNKIISEDFTQVGFGVYYRIEGAKVRTFWCAVFGQKT